MLNQNASSSEAFVVGDQKVCTIPVESSKRFSKLFGTLTTEGIKVVKSNEGFINFKVLH